MTTTIATAPDALRVPVAILTADDILREAAEALREADRLREAARDSDARLRALCRQFDKASGIWGSQPQHLRLACEMRGLMERTIGCLPQKS